MNASKFVAGAIAVTFLVGTMVPEKAHAGGADGLFGLAAGMILGSALSQGARQPVYRNRTTRPKNATVQRRAPAGQGMAAIKGKSNQPVQAASDPFAEATPASFR